MKKICRKPVASRGGAEVAVTSGPPDYVCSVATYRAVMVTWGTGLTNCLEHVVLHNRTLCVRYLFDIAFYLLFSF